ncbi:hypothetical protein M413DRAFT_191120 [Hebeloma cylindrosporum]|uniref:Uncharacterized protein n=1 Tax=Hebeloma cylindrosporum TaxID=76867 RepID=A0A0C3C756_HEBCY|nr:hypothetical protein M413DRAFT_191120 [Hebeloma cylindrosporum h7]
MPPRLTISLQLPPHIQKPSMHLDGLTEYIVAFRRCFVSCWKVSGVWSTLLFRAGRPVSHRHFSLSPPTTTRVHPHPQCSECTAPTKELPEGDSLDGGPGVLGRIYRQ